MVRRQKTECIIPASARPCRAWACAGLPVCRSHLERWCQTQPLAAVKASTRIGALAVDPIRIWIAFGMARCGLAQLAIDDARVIADWMEANGRGHGATILRWMLGETVPIEGNPNWAESRGRT